MRTCLTQGNERKASGVQLVIDAPKAQVIASASVKLDVKSDAAVTLKKGRRGYKCKGVR